MTHTVLSFTASLCCFIAQTLLYMSPNITGFQTNLIPNLSVSKSDWFWTRLIPNLSDSQPIRFLTYLVPTYMILNLSDSKPICSESIWISNSNLSDSETTWFQTYFWTYLISNLSYSELIWFQTYSIWFKTYFWIYLIVNLSDFEPIWLRTCLIPNLSGLKSICSEPVWFLTW